MIFKRFLITILAILLLASTSFAGGTINWPTACFFDSNGDPLSGGLLNSYVAGTNTRKSLYSDREGTTAHTNPEELDGNGCTEVYGVGTYKLILTDSAAGTTYFTDDNVTVSAQSVTYYYPNYNAADNCATGNSDTIKYAIDTCSTDSCTIVLQHNSGSARTEYVCDADETAGSNIKFVFEEGAELKPATGDTLTVYSPEHIIASPRQQIFDMTNTSTPAAFTIGGTFYPGNWGAVADGVISNGTGTDNSAAINAAFAVAFSSGGKVKLPSGIYKILTTVGVNIDSAAAQKAIPSLEGDQASQVQPDETDANQTGTILMLNDTAGATTALRLYNADTGTTGYMSGGEIRNLKIIRVDGSGPKDQPTDSTSSIGLETRLWVDFRMYNVVIQGFYYGWYTSWSWSWDVFGLSTTRNNYGIWLDRHTNAVSINGLQGHQNNIGIRINAGYGIMIDRATLEGQDYGIIVCNNDAAKAGPRNVTINGYNAESNSTAEILIGIDDAAAESTNTVYNVTVGTGFVDTPPATMIKVANAENVILGGTLYSEEPFLTIVGSSTRDVRVTGHPGEDAEFHAVQEAPDHRIGYHHPYNLIPNGWTQFPSLYYWREASNTVTWYDDSADTNRHVVRIESDNGDSSTKIAKVYIPLDERMWTEKMRVSLSGKRDADVTISVAMYDAANTLIVGAATLTTSWDQYAEDFAMPSGGSYVYLAIVATNSSGSAKYAYLENIVVCFREVGTLQQGPLDVIVGLSGQASTSSGEATVTLADSYTTQVYNVIATVMEDSDALVRVVKGNGSFVIHTVNVAGSDVDVNVAYMVIPTTAMYLGQGEG